MAKQVDDNIQKLLDRCRALGWEITETKTGFRVKNPMGGATTIPTSSNGRRADNALQSLNGIGLTYAEEQAGKLARLDELEKTVSITNSRPRSAPPAVFTPPAPRPPAQASQHPNAPVRVLGDKIIIEVAAGDMFTVTEIITPEKATELLERPLPRLESGQRIKQRHLDIDHVATLGGQIERGEWNKSPQGIALGIDTDEGLGGVVDGMHRLNAIVATGIAVPMRVTYNVPAEVFYTIDGGKKRSAANQLYTLGEVNTAQLASALKFLWCWRQWQENPSGPYAKWDNWHRERPSLVQLRETLDFYPELREYNKAGSRMMGRKGTPSAGAAFLTLAHRAIVDELGNTSEGAHWHERLTGFSEKVQSGEMVRRGDPPMTVRTWLENGGGEKGGARRERQVLALLKAWKAEATGKDLKIIKFVPHEAMILPYVPRIPVLQAAA